MEQLSIGQYTTLACLIEATAPKPGNVHRGADFEDLSYGDLLVAAIAIGPAMDAAPAAPLGHTILQAVRAARATVGTNANLGMVLLMAPIAKAWDSSVLEEGVGRVLGSLTPQDASDVYEAIRLAQPGGLGFAAVADVRGQPPVDLLTAMRLAAERDMVARQYAENFEHVFHFVVPRLAAALQQDLALLDAVVYVHLQLMSEFPDSLIARKRGAPVAQRAAELAGAVLRAGEPTSEPYERALGDLDFWLRSDGHRRNPGTSADLLAAGLLVALREGIINMPCRLIIAPREWD
jgi:triphosphoribosyl-dephospho-CoA synthase